jgi:hypothetical protein
LENNKNLGLAKIKETTIMKLYIFLILAITTDIAFAVTPASDLVHSAKAVKAILENHNSIPPIIDVQKVIQMSIPEKNCITVIYDRKPNTKCPNGFGVGPFMDKAFVACFNPATDEVDYVGETESQCPPQN